MTGEGEITMLQEHLATCRRLDDRLKTIRGRLDGIVPLTGERLRELEENRDIDILAFLKTFEQFEDTLGRTLKTIAMLMQFGKVERLYPRDVAQRAVALGVIQSAKTWADAVRVRNELAHEYPLQPEKQAVQVNSAWEKCATLFDTRLAIEHFVERERLLHGDL